MSGKPLELQTVGTASLPAPRADSSAAPGAARRRRTSTATPATDLSETGDKLKDELDALIDEIDEVLEENAEEFVKNYVQRGGQ